MKEDLTLEERRLLARIEASGKWDHLLYDLSLLVPSFIIMGLGIHFESPVAIIVGMVVYAGFALRMTFHQAKMLPVLKSLTKKLTEDRESPTPKSTLSSEAAPSAAPDERVTLSSWQC